MLRKFIKHLFSIFYRYHKYQHFARDTVTTSTTVVLLLAKFLYLFSAKQFLQSGLHHVSPIFSRFALYFSISIFSLEFNLKKIIFFTTVYQGNI
jgi:hypothetical protein